MRITVLCEGNDRVEFEDSLKRISNVIRELTEEYPGETIPIKMFNSTLLRQVKDFCEMFHYDMPEPIPKPLPRRFSSVVSREEVQYFEGVGLTNIAELLELADFLAIDRLAMGCSAFLADAFMTKHPEELRRIFGFPRNYESMLNN